MVPIDGCRLKVSFQMDIFSRVGAATPAAASWPTRPRRVLIHIPLLSVRILKRSQGDNLPQCPFTKTWTTSTVLRQCFFVGSCSSCDTRAQHTSVGGQHTSVGRQHTSVGGIHGRNIQIQYLQQSLRGLIGTRSFRTACREELGHFLKLHDVCSALLPAKRVQGFNCGCDGWPAGSIAHIRRDNCSKKRGLKSQGRYGR